jgi:hypothetical protein
MSKERPSLPPGWKLPGEREEAPEQKPIEEMTDEEISSAIEETKRELLRTQRQELQAREEAHASPGRRYFSGLGPRRKHWR